MKNFFDVGSPNCCESTMFRLCWARKPVTACTIPGWSGHDNVRIDSVLLLVAFDLEAGVFEDVLVVEAKDLWHAFVTCVEFFLAASMGAHVCAAFCFDATDLARDGV